MGEGLFGAVGLCSWYVSTSAFCYICETYGVVELVAVGLISEGVPSACGMSAFCDM